MKGKLTQRHRATFGSRKISQLSPIWKSDSQRGKSRPAHFCGSSDSDNLKNSIKQRGLQKPGELDFIDELANLIGKSYQKP